MMTCSREYLTGSGASRTRWTIQWNELEPAPTTALIREFIRCEREAQKKQPGRYQGRYTVATGGPYLVTNERRKTEASA